MKKIPLSNGMFAIVDDEDFDELNQWKWHFRNYAIRNSKMVKRIKGPMVTMHRQIMSAPIGMQVDHINGDKLDNRKSNLRLCNNAENARNRKISSGFSSKYKGVIFFKRDKNWMARIKVNYKSIYLGYFDTEEEAALAYNVAALSYFGEFAKLNPVGFAP